MIEDILTVALGVAALFLLHRLYGWDVSNDAAPVPEKEIQ